MCENHVGDQRDNEIYKRQQKSKIFNIILFKFHSFLGAVLLEAGRLCTQNITARNKLKTDPKTLQENCNS